MFHQSKHICMLLHPYKGISWNV